MFLEEDKAKQKMLANRCCLVAIVIVPTGQFGLVISSPHMPQIINLCEIRTYYFPTSKRCKDAGNSTNRDRLGKLLLTLAAMDHIALGNRERTAGVGFRPYFKVLYKDFWRRPHVYIHVLSYTMEDHDKLPRALPPDMPYICLSLQNYFVAQSRERLTMLLLG